MDITFNGKRALVTGAGRGIGRSVSKALVECGATVFALSRTQEHLDSLKAECPSINIQICDLMDWEHTRKLVESLGDIDLLVNNAGGNILEDFLDVTPEAFDCVFGVNLKAVINVSQVVAKRLIQRGSGGAIVNVSSQASKRTLPKHACYSSSKAGLDMLTQTMAAELGPHKIRVNAVNPTVTMTDLGKRDWTDPVKAGPMLARIPQGKFAEVKDVVEPVLYLLSDKASMINGAVLPVDGGFWTT